MTNIWQFLLQTMEVTLAAVVLLTLKRVFRDKLPPRWQYGVWALLGLRMILPAGAGGRYLSGRLAAVLETVKYMAERDLSSAYSGPYTSIAAGSVLPRIDGAPQSLTDWLFVLYAAGILALLIRYAWSYFRLRMILRGGRPASEGFCVRLDNLCEKYGVRQCRCIFLSGISSAFVCGVLRPVLVIPEGQEDIDEKILLHELLHLKYRDVLQGIFWCLLRCLHWCNPLVWYVGGRIACDMESLCDQRVLERLTGEERRDYGRILLSMTNEKYANAVGTTSLSNGGQNIAKRIQAIAHFKKYPKGMALASVCICVLLAGPLFGSVSAMDMPEGRIRTGYLKPGWDKDYAMSAARLHRCSTQAGAIDTYIKGVISLDPVYMAAALPMEKQGKEMEEFKANTAGFIGTRCYMGILTMLSGYNVYNLESDDKGEHHVQVVFRWPKEGLDVEDWAEVEWSYAVFPLKLNWDGSSWTAELDETPYYYETQEEQNTLEQGIFTEVPWTSTWQGKGESGAVRIDEQLVQSVDQGKAGMCWQADPDAVFTDRLYRVITFRSSWNAEQREAVRHVGLQACLLEHVEDEPELQDTMSVSDDASWDSGGSSSHGIMVSGKWDGNIEVKEGFVSLDDQGLSRIEGYAVRVFIDGACVETIKIKRGDSL